MIGGDAFSQTLEANVQPLFSASKIVSTVNENRPVNVSTPSALMCRTITRRAALDMCILVCQSKAA